MVSLCHYGVFNSGVKYLSKTTLKYYLSSYLGYLYFTIHVFDSFYFTTFLKKIMYFLLHTYSLKRFDRKMVQFTHTKRTSLVIPTVSDLADSQNTNASFVNYVLAIRKYILKNKKIVPSGLLNMSNLKWFIL